MFLVAQSNINFKGKFPTYEMHVMYYLLLEWKKKNWTVYLSEKNSYSRTKISYKWVKNESYESSANRMIFALAAAFFN